MRPWVASVLIQTLSILSVYIKILTKLPPSLSFFALSPGFVRAADFTCSHFTKETLVIQVIRLHSVFGGLHIGPQ